MSKTKRNPFVQTNLENKRQGKNFVNGERKRTEKMKRKKKDENFEFSNLNLGINLDLNEKWGKVIYSTKKIPEEIQEKPEDKNLIFLGGTVPSSILKKMSLYEDIQKALERKERREKFLSKHA